MNGRTPDFRLVHFGVGDSQKVRPGDFVTVEVTDASPNHLVAAKAPTSIRTSRGGDAHSLLMQEVGEQKIMLGLPSLKKIKAMAD
jgi:tRNA-2-methylthio-N6-dimethylallyladenosine synthase